MLALKIVLLALLICTAFDQGDGGSAILPVEVPALELAGNGTECPTDLLRMEARGNITRAVRDIINSTVLEDV